MKRQNKQLRENEQVENLLLILDVYLISLTRFLPKNIYNVYSYIIHSDWVHSRNNYHICRWYLFRCWRLTLRGLMSQQVLLQQ